MAESIESLIDAASNHDVDRVRALLTAGADPNARDARGRTALYGAAGNARVIEVLIEGGADANLESTGESEGLPICFAASWGATEAVRALLEGGADPNLREDAGTGSSPLLWAAWTGHAAVVEALLEAGADPNLACDGRTPLCEAAERGSVSVVRLLLAAGADPDVTSPDGRTPLEIAEAWAGKDVEAELRRRTARFAHAGEEIESRRRSLADGTELIEVGIASTFYSERETGYSAIVELLRSPADRTS